MRESIEIIYACLPVAIKVAIIYLIRTIVLLAVAGKNIIPQLFLAPRGLITILLFFAIPENLSSTSDLEGVLLFVILLSCVVMSWALIEHKKKLAAEFLDYENKSSSLEDESEIIEE